MLLSFTGIYVTAYLIFYPLGGGQREAVTAIRHTACYHDLLELSRFVPLAEMMLRVFATQLRSGRHNCDTSGSYPARQHRRAWQCCLRGLQRPHDVSGAPQQLQVLIDNSRIIVSQTCCMFASNSVYFSLKEVDDVAHTTLASTSAQMFSAGVHRLPQYTYLCTMCNKGRPSGG